MQPQMWWLTYPKSKQIVTSHIILSHKVFALVLDSIVRFWLRLWIHTIAVQAGCVQTSCHPLCNQENPKLDYRKLYINILFFTSKPKTLWRTDEKPDLHRGDVLYTCEYLPDKESVSSRPVQASVTVCGVRHVTVSTTISIEQSPNLIYSCTIVASNTPAHKDTCHKSCEHSVTMTHTWLPVHSLLAFSPSSKYLTIITCHQPITSLVRKHITGPSLACVVWTGFALISLTCSSRDNIYTGKM